MSFPSRQDLWFLHLSVFLFGLTGLFGRSVEGGAWAIVSGRTLFAALALLGFLLIQHKSLAVSRSDWSRFFLSGFLLTVHWWTFFYAISVSSVAVGLLGFAAYPIFVILLEPVVTGEHGSKTDFWLVTIVTMGLLLVVPEYRLESDATHGLIWALLSGFLFALLTLANRRLARYGAARLALWQNVIAALLSAPLGWPLLARVSPPEWVWLLLLGVVFTALAHGLFIASLRTVPGRLAAVVVALEPVYGTAFAWLLFSECPPARTFAGGAVILIVTTWTSLHRRRQRTTEPIATGKPAPP